jgi:hypothetical protein
MTTIDEIREPLLSIPEGEQDSHFRLLHQDVRDQLRRGR